MEGLPYSKYEMVIGLEVHVQLSTNSKAFCADATTFGAAPNTQVSPISLAHPGTLPKLNQEQVAYAVRLGLALGSKINQRNTFDRKNYFYADLPKGYQITQDLAPICIGGQLELKLEDQTKNIRIHHIHMEEDAGKSIHDADPQASLIDLNRAGVPLLEVVTEPDLRSPEEVDLFMSTIRQLVRYLGVSDGNMEEGAMRCDCNVSVRLKGEQRLGERCEIKNVNSMRYARRAIAYEYKRQIDLIEAGGRVEQQTLNFDPETGVTTPIRDKEDAHDYRYFPEPDLPPVVLTDEFVAATKAALPALPWELKEKFKSAYHLSEYDAQLLTEEQGTALFFEGLATQTEHHKEAANLVINKLLPFCKEEKIGLSNFPANFEQLSSFIKLIKTGKVSQSIAYSRLFPAWIKKIELPPLAVAESLNLIQIGDEDFLDRLIEEVIEKNPQKVAAYHKGKKGLLGFFMGELMRSSKGKADPKSANAMMRKKLEAYK